MKFRSKVQAFWAGVVGVWCLLGVLVGRWQFVGLFDILIFHDRVYFLFDRAKVRARRANFVFDRAYFLFNRAKVGARRAYFVFDRAKVGARRVKVVFNQAMVGAKLKFFLC